MPAKNEAIRKQVVAALKKHKRLMSRGEIAAAVGAEPHTLPLRQMRDEGLIAQTGERGQATYQPAK
jgi:hypothetical protein